MTLTEVHLIPQNLQFLVFIGDESSSGLLEIKLSLHFLIRDAVSEETKDTNKAGKPGNENRDAGFLPLASSLCWECCVSPSLFFLLLLNITCQINFISFSCHFQLETFIIPSSNIHSHPRRRRFERRHLSLAFVHREALK